MFIYLQMAVQPRKSWSHYILVRSRILTINETKPQIPTEQNMELFKLNLFCSSPYLKQAIQEEDKRKPVATPIGNQNNKPKAEITRLSGIQI